MKQKTKQRLKTGLAFLGLMLVCGLLYLLFWFFGEPEAVKEQRKISQSAAALTKVEPLDAQPASQPKTAVMFETGLEDLPKSLEGSDVDGDIIIDENNQLVVTNGLCRLFDYFLTTQGEEDLETIIARIEAYISHRTPEPARSQAIAVLHQYIGYLKATVNISEAGGKPASEIDINAVVEQKQRLHELRKQHFSSKTIEAFFGSEEVYDNYSIELFKLSKNTHMSDEEKQAAQKALVDKLPDGAMKEQIQSQHNYSEVISGSQDLKAKGASEAELFEFRQQLVGAEAAKRLADLDVEQAQWQKRVQDYLDARSAILQNSTTDAQKQQQIETLRHRGFTLQEQKRLDAYEAIGKASLE